jgi:hypothetical protein
MGLTPETLIKPPTLPTQEELRTLIDELDGKHPPQFSSAVDDAIHRLLMRRPGTAIHPSFEDIQSQMDPADFIAITKLREKIEQQG